MLIFHAKKRSVLIFMKGQYECHHLVNNFPQMPAVQNETLSIKGQDFLHSGANAKRTCSPGNWDFHVWDTTDLLFYLFYCKKWRHHAQGKLMDFFSHGVLWASSISHFYEMPYFYENSIKKIPPCMFPGLNHTFKSINFNKVMY